MTRKRSKKSKAVKCKHVGMVWKVDIDKKGQVTHYRCVYCKVKLKPVLVAED